MSWSCILLVSSPTVTSAPSLSTSILNDLPCRPTPTPAGGPSYPPSCRWPSPPRLPCLPPSPSPPSTHLPLLSLSQRAFPWDSSMGGVLLFFSLSMLQGQGPNGFFGVVHLQFRWKIMPCPSTNPGCISSNPKSSSFAFPWRIPDGSLDQDPVQKLELAILKTQKNPKIISLEDTPYGIYLLAEVDGGFGRDVLEFLVKGDVVGYRSMATKVTYVYPFTTALGDSKGQEDRLKEIIDQLGWYAPSPSFDSID